MPQAKWIILTIVVLAGAYFGLKAYFAIVANGKVTQELRADPQGERAALAMLLTFPDGRMFPVNYLREGNLVFAGADGRWWREFREGNVPVTVEIRGEVFSGKASVVLDDPHYTRDVFKRLRPNVPKWLPLWLDAYLVVIELDL
jgi:hypothetical protein